MVVHGMPETSLCVDKMTDNYEFSHFHLPLFLFVSHVLNIYNGCIHMSYMLYPLS